jgi:hypothetical protein
MLVTTNSENEHKGNLKKSLKQYNPTKPAITENDTTFITTWQKGAKRAEPPKCHQTRTHSQPSSSRPLHQEQVVQQAATLPRGTKIYLSISSQQRICQYLIVDMCAEPVDHRYLPCLAECMISPAHAAIKFMIISNGQMPLCGCQYVSV